uniref:Uncharacterized protein n=1 Tax=Alexandrium monilatum TaxID=311494 RepID=A0A7S4RGH7_9DINO
MIGIILTELSRRLACWFDLYLYNPKLASESFQTYDMAAALAKFGWSASGPLTSVQQPRTQGTQWRQWLKRWGPLAVLVIFAEQFPVQCGKFVLEDPCAFKNYMMIRHWSGASQERMALHDSDDSACLAASLLRHAWQAHLG